jgi:UDP-N-acetyl-D-mannosaminuronate dehydrogenase
MTETHTLDGQLVTHTTLLERIRSRKARVGIIGLGYVGLPLARAFAGNGFPVLGFDIDPNKIAKLQRGESYIGQIPDRVIRTMRDQRFEATCRFERLDEADAIVICVPTPLTDSREPDLTYVVNSVKSIATTLRPGQLIILESTTYPTTTRKVVLPILEAEGLVAGQDFFLAFSPEREDPGNRKHSVTSIPKVVGGLDDKSSEVAVALYRSVVADVVRVSTPEVAEACKILENTYRAINIALVNELKVLYDRMGIDVWEVIDAAKTKPFGFQAFYPGPGLGGHCLAGYEFVTVRDQVGVRTLPLRELFARYAAARQINTGGVEEVFPVGLEALSIHPTTGQAEFKPITQMFCRPSPTPLLKLTMRGNRTLTVTDGHPMLVTDNEGIVERRADALAEGDRAILCKTWGQLGAWSDTIDLIDLAEKYEVDGVRVMPKNGRWADHDSVVRPAARLRGHSAKDIYRHNTLPLSVFRALEQANEAPFARSELQLSTGKGSGWNQVPAVITIDEELARFIGYYLSEGCLTHDKSWRMRITFGAHEAELIADVQSILERWGFRYSIYRPKTCATVQMKVSSILLGLLLRDELGCGVRSEDAAIPARLMAGPVAIRRAVLAGLLRGDGDVDAPSGPRTYRKNSKEYTHAFNTATVGYFSSSPVLLQQVTLLLQGDGLVPTFRPNKPYLRVAGAQAAALSPLLVAKKQAALLQAQAERVRTIAPRSWRDHGTYASVAIKAIERVPAEEVYSIEVADHHTFVTTGGIAVHNCIPIDPFYLTWVARQYGLTTRFIELAGEINTSMPHFVINKLADTLNEVGKPLKGSRVGILGMAYKKDVDDPRESPGFELMDLLLKKGAQVTYNDPFIPNLPRMRHYPHLQMASQPLSETWLGQQDAILVVTDHTAYDWPWIVQQAKVIVDTRNATHAVLNGREKIVRA